MTYRELPVSPVTNRSGLRALAHRRDSRDQLGPNYPITSQGKTFFPPYDVNIYQAVVTKVVCSGARGNLSAFSTFDV